MDKQTDKGYKIAAATSDGIVVNSHFGWATQFYIYQVDKGKAELVEIRKTEHVCQGGYHDDSRLKEQITKLSDCRYVLVSRIGEGAAGQMEAAGIEPIEVPDMLPKAIEKVLLLEKIKHLF